MAAGEQKLVPTRKRHDSTNYLLFYLELILQFRISSSTITDTYKGFPVRKRK